MWSIVGSNSFIHLNLSLNRLVHFEQPFPNGFTTSVTVLDLHSNNFEGQIPLLPLFASYMDYLNNNFTSHIPDDIGDYLSSANFFSSLRVLVLRRSKFFGSIECPDIEISWINLQILDLASNNFGSILHSRYFSS